MRRRVWLLALALVVLLASGASPGASNPSGIAGSDIVELERDYAHSRPLTSPATIVLQTPKGTESVQLHYRQLGFDGAEHVLDATLAPGRATAVIPTEHTTEPGIAYNWEVVVAGDTYLTGESFLPFVYPFDTSSDKSVVATEVFHDIEKAGGKLPNGYQVTAGQARIPHSQSASLAPITSKLAELRTTGTNPHKGIDWGIDEKPVLAVMGGYVHDKGYEATGWGYWILLRHENSNYFSHYAHLKELPTISIGAAVTKGAQIGVSGNSGSSTGPHLDSCMNYYGSGSRIPLYPFQWFLDDDYGYSETDFDYVQTPTDFIWAFSSDSATDERATPPPAYTEVMVEPKGTSGGASSVLIVYREKGTVGWTTATMSQVSGTTTYRYTWPTALNGKLMQYYIKVSRESVPGVWVTRPARYDSNDPGIYYEFRPM